MGSSKNTNYRHCEDSSSEAISVLTHITIDFFTSIRNDEAIYRTAHMIAKSNQNVSAGLLSYLRTFKFLWIVILFLFNTATTFSQTTVYTTNSGYTTELGIFLGGSYYIGDLNQGGHFNQFTLPGGGILYRHNYNPRFTIRATAFYGNIGADDAETNSAAQKQRNLHFKSYIIEASGQMEFNFMPYKIGDENYPFSPYLFLGIGLFKFNPKAKLNGQWYDLQPLGTEGQGTSSNLEKKYSLIQASIPFGAGMKFNIGETIGLSIEWGMRRTFTDYLDDVSSIYSNPALLAAGRGDVAAALSDRSLMKDNGVNNTGRQRGFSGTRDWYSFSGIILSFKLGGKKEKCYNLK